MAVRCRQCDAIVGLELARQCHVFGRSDLHRGNELVVYADIDHQTAGRLTIATGTFQVLGATQTQNHSAVVVKFVTFGVATEIVVIVEQKNASIGAHFFTVEPSSRQAAHASAHHDKVIMFIQCFVMFWFFTAPG